MATRFQSNIDSLTAPPGNGSILIWPNGQDLVRLADENRRQRRSRPVRLLDQPASLWSEQHDEDGFVFMTGHQPDFFHAGVWAKNTVASSLAQNAGGTARFLVVDSDVPNRIAIQWPDQGDQYCTMRGVSAAIEMHRRSYEYVAEGKSLDFAKFFAAIPETVRGNTTSMAAFISGFMQEKADYVDRWMNGIQSVERELGVRSPSFVRISHIFGWDSSPELHGSASAFVAHIILSAAEYAAAYNRALARYRERRGIRGQQRPIPDLLFADERIELPFWMLSDAKPRQRLAISREGTDGIGIWAGASKVCTLERDELRRNPAESLLGGLGSWRVRPRALAQTMFARLLACDLFIHGIGGAKYDQITDDIIREFFDVEPPAYACVSATLWLPMRRFGVEVSDLRAGRQKARDLRYNPQRFMGNGDRPSALSDMLIRREEAIRESERLRVEQAHNRAARRLAYDRIHRVNAELRHAVSELAKQLDRRIIEIGEQIEHDRIAKSRDWFFALHPRNNLIQLYDILKSKL